MSDSNAQVRYEYKGTISITCVITGIRSLTAPAKLHGCIVTESVRIASVRCR